MWIETSIQVYTAILQHHGKEMESQGALDIHFNKIEWRFKGSDAPLVKREIAMLPDNLESRKYFIYYHKNEE